MPDFEITVGKDTYDVTATNEKEAWSALQQMLSNKETKPSQEKVGVAEDVLRSAVGGLGRGAVGALEFPELAGRGVIRGFQELGQLTGLYEGEDLPVFDTGTGRALRGAAEAVGLDDELDYRGQTTAGKYVGTASEFLGGAGALGTAGKVTKGLGALTNLDKVQKAGAATQAAGLGVKPLTSSAVAGVGSEAAGQATEGTSIEPVARVIGAFASPMALSTANKTVQSINKRFKQKPTVEMARANKNALYADAKKAGVDVDIDMASLNNNITDSITKNDLFIGYTPGVHTHIDSALKILSSRSKNKLNIAQLDALRSDLKKIYKSGKGLGEFNYDPRIDFIIDKVDEAMDTMPQNLIGTPAGEKYKVARNANRQYRKMELFDDLIKKAELETAATGSGGNIVNKYRQALKNILVNKNKSAQFDSEELSVMERFVKGDMTENTLRLIGKLSPTGNGLMAALNIGAVATNPALVAIPIAGAVSKVASDKMALNSVQAVKDMLYSGVAPNKRKLISDREIRVLLGLQAD